MQHARTNTFKERKLSVAIRIEDLDRDITDSRFGFKLGTTRQLCQQYGVSISTKGKMATLSSSRDRLQMVVGLLYYANVKYAVLS